MPLGSRSDQEAPDGDAPKRNSVSRVGEYSTAGQGMIALRVHCSVDLHVVMETDIGKSDRDEWHIGVAALKLDLAVGETACPIIDDPGAGAARPADR